MASSRGPIAELACGIARQTRMVCAPSSSTDARSHAPTSMQIPATLAPAGVGLGSDVGRLLAATIGLVLGGGASSGPPTDPPHGFTTTTTNARTTTTTHRPR